MKNFTGIDAPYEAPERPELHLHTMDQLLGQLAERVLSALADRGIVGVQN